MDVVQQFIDTVAARRGPRFTPSDVYEFLCRVPPTRIEMQRALRGALVPTVKHAKLTMFYKSEKRKQSDAAHIANKRRKENNAVNPDFLKDKTCSTCKKQQMLPMSLSQGGSKAGNAKATTARFFCVFCSMPREDE